MWELSLWRAFTADVWEPKARYCATHCQDMVVVPHGLWLASGSLHWFGVVSKDSLYVGVAVLLAFVAPLYKMGWVPRQSCFWPGSAFRGSRDSPSRIAQSACSQKSCESHCLSLTHTYNTHSSPLPYFLLPCHPASHHVPSLSIGTFKKIHIENVTF